MRRLIGQLFNPETYQLLIRGRKRPIRLFPDAIGITVNCCVNYDGEAVMGAGCAKEARNKWPELPKMLGSVLKQNPEPGIHVFDIDEPFRLLTIPVKYAQVICLPDKSNITDRHKDSAVPNKSIVGWKSRSNIVLIGEMLTELHELTNEMKWKTVVIPRIGCGCGELDWHNDVRGVAETILDDNRFYVISFS